MLLTLDHFAITSETLEAGVAATEAALGLPLGPGGQHPRMGTHNRLLGLGDVYLEVIAIDPQAAPPDRPRWFDIDSFSGAPRLTNWIARTDDLPAALAAAPAGAGVPLEFTRGDLRWEMAVPDDGKLPFDGCFPAMIQWHGAARGPAHPTARLADSGCRLRRLTLVHPRANDLRAALAGLIEDRRLAVTEGAVRAIRAEIDTPHGPRVLE